MNITTCGALLCLRIEAVSNDKRIVFATCLGLSILGHWETHTKRTRILSCRCFSAVVVWKKCSINVKIEYKAERALSGCSDSVHIKEVLITLCAPTEVIKLSCPLCPHTATAVRQYQRGRDCPLCTELEFNSEVGIYKRKKESKRTGKHAFDQESDQEKQKENTILTKKAIKKRKKPCFFLFFLLSCFLI